MNEHRHIVPSDSIERNPDNWHDIASDTVVERLDTSPRGLTEAELARRFPEFQPEAADILDQAMASETAGSVLARVRRELRRGF